MSFVRLNCSGYSLTEVVFGILAAAILVRGITPAVIAIIRWQARTVLINKEESNRRLLKMQLASRLKKVPSGKIYLDNAMANYLGIGAGQLFNSNLYSNDLLHFTYGILRSAGRVLGAPSTVADSSGNYDVLALLSHSYEATLTVTTDTNYSNSTLAPGSIFNLPIAGDTTGYHLNDVVILSSSHGKELAIVNSVNSGSLSLEVGYASALPITFFPKSTLINKLDVHFVGTDANYNNIQMVRVVPSSHASVSISSIQRSPSELRLSPAPIESLDDINPKGIEPRSSLAVLRILWSLPELPIGSSEQRLMELGL